MIIEHPLTEHCGGGNWCFRWNVDRHRWEWWAVGVHCWHALPAGVVAYELGRSWPRSEDYAVYAMTWAEPVEGA